MVKSASWPVTSVKTYWRKRGASEFAHRLLDALDERSSAVNIRRDDSGPRSAPPTSRGFSSLLRIGSNRMMMAHDSSSPPPSRLDDDTVAAVRDGLRAYLSNPAHTAPLQEALLRVSAEARERALLPEQLLVVLKGIWGALPEVRAMTDASEQVRLLQRVVTMCIKEYYSA